MIKEIVNATNEITAITNETVNITNQIAISTIGTITGLAITSILSRINNFFSIPIFDIYFFENNKKTYTLNAPKGPGFNIPIYVSASNKFKYYPFKKKSWKVLINIITEPGLDIYLLTKLPSGKYTMGEHTINSSGATFLGPEKWGAGAQLLQTAKLPLKLVVQIYLENRDKPYTTKVLTLS